MYHHNHGVDNTKHRFNEKIGHCSMCTWMRIDPGCIASSNSCGWCRTAGLDPDSWQREFRCTRTRQTWSRNLSASVFRSLARSDPCWLRCPLYREELCWGWRSWTSRTSRRWKSCRWSRYRCRRPKLFHGWRVWHRAGSFRWRWD
jgi:hypothetical protein